MTEVFEKLRTAFEAANVNHDAEFGYAGETISESGTQVNQLRIQYSGGNEYIRIDHLMKSLAEVGKILLFEFRGRGGRESPRLVVEVEIDDQVSVALLFAEV